MGISYCDVGKFCYMIKMNKYSQLKRTLLTQFLELNYMVMNNYDFIWN